MKQGIHPDYHPVVFEDSSTGTRFSLAQQPLQVKLLSGKTGKNYPLIRVEVTSDSHPFYTGKQKFTQADGAVDKFNKKYGLK